MNEQEAAILIEKINTQVSQGRLRLVDFKRMDQKNPFDSFVIAYFKYASDQIDDQSVIDNHWKYFQKGWQAVPYFIKVLETNTNSESDRIQALEYLKLFATPTELRYQIFRPEELIFTNQRHDTPKFVAKLIVQSISFLQLQEIEDLLLVEKAALIEKQSMDLLKENMDLGFEDYELPDSF